MNANKVITVFFIIFSIRIANYACGPFFPEQLLVDRNTTLNNLVEGTFFFEAAHLVEKPKDSFAQEKLTNWYYSPDEQRKKIETLLFGESSETVLQKMRKASGANEAYQIGAGLPEEIRHYTSGAVAFNSGDYSEAMHQFRMVMQLPKNNRKKVGLWAQYMLGRSYTLLGDSVNALKAFQSVRNFALQGAMDSLGLAVASFGEEARIHLQGNDYSKAIYFYSLQAASGSESGTVSLLYIARKIVANDTLLVTMLSDTLCQKLVFAYLYSRSNEVNESQNWSDSADSGKLFHILDIVEKLKLNKLSGVDKLAAAAYRAARFDLAEKLCKKTNTGLSWWVRAKLDLHKGRISEAAKDYHEALKYFSANTIWYSNAENGSVVPSKRIQGELSSVYLKKGEFMAAMKLLYESSPIYWLDAAYVAEKILTVDELKKYVDENVKITNKDSIKIEYLSYSDNSAAKLRYLLARRLLREKHFKDAIKYFDDSRIKQKAELYTNFYRKANSSKGVKSASNWYYAAKLARFDGMELLGYELDPDYLTFMGEYSLGEIDSSTISGIYVSPDEYKRLRENQPKPDKRFSYRYVAIEYIEKATSQVPVRSQAYVAMLSKAYHWISNTDYDLGQKLYSEYVHNGAYVPWAFEYSVPEPDFQKAQAMAKAEKIEKVKKIAKRYIKSIRPLGIPIVILLSVIITIGLFLVKRNKSKK